MLNAITIQNHGFFNTVSEDREARLIKFRQSTLSVIKKYASTKVREVVQSVSAVVNYTVVSLGLNKKATEISPRKKIKLSINNLFHIKGKALIDGEEEIEMPKDLEDEKVSSKEPFFPNPAKSPFEMPITEETVTIPGVGMDAIQKADGSKESIPSIIDLRVKVNNSLGEQSVEIPRDEETKVLPVEKPQAQDITMPASTISEESSPETTKTDDSVIEEARALTAKAAANMTNLKGQVEEVKKELEGEKKAREIAEFQAAEAKKELENALSAKNQVENRLAQTQSLFTGLVGDLKKLSEESNYQKEENSSYNRAA